MWKSWILTIGILTSAGIIWYFYVTNTQDLPKATFTLTSAAFNNNEAIPQKYTCDGENISPELHWENLPKGTMRLALVVDDPDAAKKPSWIHWVIYNIPTDVSSLGEGAKVAFAHMPNDSGNKRYDGPCPPRGSGIHHYRFRLYALPKVIQHESPILEQIINPNIGVAELVGTYERK